MRNERQMVGEAPHVKFQFRVDERTTANIMSFFGQNAAKIAPTLTTEHHLLGGFEHTPTYGAAIIGIHFFVYEETRNILICPLHIQYRLDLKSMYYT